MEPYSERPLSQYLDDAASGAPTPGGGSAAALAGALAAAMASMVGAFTLSSEKYMEAHPEAERIRRETESLRETLTRLVQADVDAYASVSRAHALPKTTPEEKAARREAVRDASAEALGPPLKTLRAIRGLAGLLPRLAEIGNRNLLSDAAVAAVLARAAADAAAVNVRVNCNGLGDRDRAAALEAEVAAACRSVHEACDAALERVERA
ncbi:MAG: cyclodeaminase/cyclohydrolase family protein [Planctomycetota bacterium]